MSIQTPRHQWMQDKISQAFGELEGDDILSYFHHKKHHIKTFMDGAISKLFFFYQPQSEASAKKTLFMSTGDHEKVTGKCVYFLNTNKKAIKTQVGSDETVLSGELNANILEVLTGTLSSLYQPILGAQDKWGDYGGASAKDRKDFLAETARLSDDLRRKLDNLKGDIELPSPKAPFNGVEQKPSAYQRAAHDDALVEHFSDILNQWSVQITRYIRNDPSSVPLSRKDNSGPDVEIDYWTRRMPTLISVTEQLKNRRNRVVTGVLKARANMDRDGVMPSGRSPKQLLEKWREVDMLITDALNEAKDNLRFLSNLRKVLEPLYTESPQVILETMSALMNSMKMIHTLSRHYGTATRMTNLFERISNQLISRCKEEIYGGVSAHKLWEQDPTHVTERMKTCITMFDTYTHQYQDIKQKLAATPKGKQFDFDEGRIFAKPSLFCRRLEKLVDMFSSVKQFQALENKHIDGMHKLIASFKHLIGDFQQKGHDLLDYCSTSFERDFVEYTMHNSGLENAIQEFMGRSLEDLSSIDKQLDLIRNFRDILHRQSLQDDLEHKYLHIFNNFGKDLHNIQQLYEKYKNDPPIPRNMARIAGNIHWSRQLLRRITTPMNKFRQNPKVFHPKESRKIIKHYNRLVATLIEFEQLWFNAWKKGCDAVKRGLRSPLIAAVPGTQDLAVNFDRGVLELIQESKHLQLMNFELPNAAKTVLLLEDKLKLYYNQVSAALVRFNSIVADIRPEMEMLLRPHMTDLYATIRPAMSTLTWTSLNIESFLLQLDAVLDRFSLLVSHLNDIIHNRVCKNVDLVSRLLLLHLADNSATFTLKEFMGAQRKHLAQCADILAAKNVEIERAVNDLLAAVDTYPLRATNNRTDAEAAAAAALDMGNRVKLHYCHLMYHALVSSAHDSLTALKARLSSSAHPAVSVFEVDLNLQVSEVCFSPRMTEVEATLSDVANDVVRCCKNVLDWGLDDAAEARPRRPFYEKVATDSSLKRALQVLEHAGAESRRLAEEKLAHFQAEFQWLWQQEPEDEYQKFVTSGNRILEDFIAELSRFVDEERKINSIQGTLTLGAFAVNTENLQQQLKNETERWKYQYSEKLHQEAKRDMEETTDLMKELKIKLEREVKDFASLKFVMDAQSELRDVQSSIDMRFVSIIERYNILEQYLPTGVMSKEEMDAKSVLKTEWSSILHKAGTVMETVSALQGGFKKDLKQKVARFRQDVDVFRKEYEKSGPMVPHIAPEEAMTRLNKFKREYESLSRKHDLYTGGEKLFGLPEQAYPMLTQTGKELRLLDQLYSLYQAVISTVEQYKDIPWSEVVASISEMNEKVEGFLGRCKKLPKQLREWPAYVELSRTISDFIEVLPLLNELSKPAMRARHWQEISQLTKEDFDLKKFNELKLRQVLGADLLQYREEIEEIAEGAVKQLGIEKKIHEIVSLWESQAFTFSLWKDRGEVILNGASVADIVEQLEESQASLIQMLTMRHVTPFRANAQAWLKKLSEVNDVLEGWVRVQQLWMSLEAVFTGGDIARQMPQDTRVFMNVDKEWTTRMMNKAKTVANVVNCCQNEYIKNMLPTMYTDLEKCQKALDGYLEAKRSKFPRFYFVSNSALLVILSQGSDKEAVQSAFSKIFDSIDRVEFKGNNIVKILQQQSGFEGKMDAETIALSKPVQATGNIEDWMGELLHETQRTIKDIVRGGAQDFDSLSLNEYLDKYCAQVSLLGIQFMWTNDVQEALIRARHDKKAMDGALAKQMANLEELSAMTTSEISTKMQRTKIETLVTIQVHQRDVLEDLCKRFRKKELRGAHDFEWQKQMRCYWVPEDDACVVRIADVEFEYCYEYLGCKERLVVTPLTDRCYISLSQAIGMFFGGAPAGPAGTGKTETVKDLGRALGKYVVVFNCSDQMKTRDTAKIYKGLCQSGSWGCFDEFNRIDLEVLSVVAQQVMAILNAMRTRANKFTFPGDMVGDVTLDPRCGFFITMNPGYAGRQELPENLKALFRGVAMMVPDREIIIKVKLASVGYTDFVRLSKKFRVLYNLCEEQLSKQRHYDFGLRNILSVLRTAGVNLRVELQRDGTQDKVKLEEMLMMRTLRDMNLSKLVADDVGLFISLLHDLFPNQDDPEKRRYAEEEAAMREVIVEKGLIHHEQWVNKIIQLYETSLVRHGLMMVGPAGGGKTMATEVLLEALSRCKEKHTMVRMNPKAITAEQMFGQNDIISGEWTHGIFSSLWSKYNDAKKHRTWIVCDGPVDAIWIENLNTVLDDNKLLTLANGDRIPMTDNVRLLFEVQDLRNASPATVSRAGIVFVSESDLGTAPLVQAWLLTRRDEEREILEVLYRRYFDERDVLEWLHHHTRNVMPVQRAHLVTNLLKLMEGLLQESVKQLKVYNEIEYERLFLYAMIWSLGSLLEATDRRKFHAFLHQSAEDNRMVMPMCANDDETVYDFHVEMDERGQLAWTRWAAREWKYPKNFKFSTCLVPTVETVRAESLITLLANQLGHPVLIVGSSGTAKTSTVLQYTSHFDPSVMLLKKINFSSATTPNMFQTSIEADIEKRQGKTFAPSGGRHMTVFLDDLSMPEVNTWGDQPTLEIVRQLVETGGFYFLEKDKRGDRMVIDNLQFIGAMNHPGGGRNDIPNRLKRHFFCFNNTPPSQDSIDNIYGSMLRGRFSQRRDLIDTIPYVTKATIDLWSRVRGRMLPTPSKFHYIFNMRDLSRVFQGVIHAPVDVLDTSSGLIDLWRHECMRVFSDKLTCYTDKQWYWDTFLKVTHSHFGAEVARQCRQDEKQPTYFVDFQRDAVVDPETDEVEEEAPKVYERVVDLVAVKTRVNDLLTHYNEQAGVKEMNLVLFTDALEHMMRIARIIGMPRGNAMLVGVGGSGRQSLARLAAHIAGHHVFQLSITRTYKMSDFLEDIRKLYVLVGKEGKSVTWIVGDFDIVNENFLEYINAILSTGEVAGLFPKDERDMMCSDLRAPAKRDDANFLDTPDNLYKYFIDRIRDNLHIVMCFSPANEKFAERARRFPALINGCTIDWFLPWPEEALIDVSTRFLMQDDNFKVDCSAEVSEHFVRYIAGVHNKVTAGCAEYFQRYRRNVHVTPKSYLSFIKSFKSLYKRKYAEVSHKESNVISGLTKLRQAERDVAKMQGDLEQQQRDLAEADRAATAMIKELEEGAKKAAEQKAIAAEIEHACKEEAEVINRDKDIANKELEAAMPYVVAAEEAAKSVNKKDLGTIQRFGTPPDLIKRIMDCVLILTNRKLELVKMTKIKTGRDDTQMFVADSYDTYAKKMMIEKGFIQMLLEFANTEKDKINEETMEFLEPYLSVVDFTAERAKSVSSAAEGICKWVRAMHDYHNASLVVGPRLEELKVKSDLYDVAYGKLLKAQSASAGAQAEVERLQEAFAKTMAEKALLEHKAKATLDKMKAANDLIGSLANEKERWSEDADKFANNKQKLVGDCALACAFVSYCGPFNHDFRRKLLETKFYADALERGIPVTADLNVTHFLVDPATVAEWNSQGLPKDDLSVQNGILVTQASRFPLLIDPQGQALSWLKRREADNFPVWGTSTLSNPKLREQLEYCLGEGKPLLIEGVVKDVDPMFDPVLERNITKKGRSYNISLGDRVVSYDKSFRLYLITKLSNPTFSPELSAKTTIIDFSVTQRGLEDQLLSRVIQQEQSNLEEQRQKLTEEVNMNTIALQKLDKLLLDRLGESKGDLLDDVELIAVLADTKHKAREVQEKIQKAAETEASINQKREQYRPVATRGSVLYFTIVDTSSINCMYQTSLHQFLGWFDGSMVEAPKANLVAKRVSILIDHITWKVYENMNRGLFEQDKLTFKLMVTLKIMLTESPQLLNQDMVSLLLRANGALGGAGGDEKHGRRPFDWLQESAWNNILELTRQLDFFRDLRNIIAGDESEWRKWYEREAPEESAVPSIEQRLQNHPSGPFLRLLLIRSIRDDRTRLASSNFIGAVLGEKFTQPLPTQLHRVWGQSDAQTPVILLLTPGADPTATLEELAKKVGVHIAAVSMGEGQEPHAMKCLGDSMKEGGWSLLQNCHLGLGFMTDLEERLKRMREECDVDPNFRLWITCEPHSDFPMNLLQMSIKVTNEPPRGLKAGLIRSYTTVVDEDRLCRVGNSKEWRDLVFVVCFIHSVVQERRKFGPVGWSIPYEFNQSDLEASLTFLEKHFFTCVQSGLSWDTIQYMIGEVQYGGRITDDFDRILFNTLGKNWLCPKIFDQTFEFAKTHGDFTYALPNASTISEYRQFINEFPKHDTPEIFGMHQNADLTLGTNEANYILNTIADTQPKESVTTGNGKTREEIVVELASQLLKTVPADFNVDDVRAKVRRRPRAELETVLGVKNPNPATVDGFSIPLNVFLFQEVIRLQGVIEDVRGTLEDLIQAINGEIIMTPELQNALNSIYDGKPPKSWCTDAGGTLKSWIMPSLSLWFNGLLEREKQLSSWLNDHRPASYWLTGFFNPQGFLTAMRQEVTRRHKDEKWALDDVVLLAKVTDIGDNKVKKLTKGPDDGVYIHGLFLEGCSWDERLKVLSESQPKELFTSLPVLHVTALTSRKAESFYGDNRFYNCPVYSRPRRTDQAFIFTVKLPTVKAPDHWVTRGVALLCSKD